MNCRLVSLVCLPLVLAGCSPSDASLPAGPPVLAQQTPVIEGNDALIEGALPHQSAQRSVGSEERS